MRDVPLGGDAPITVPHMTNPLPSDPPPTMNQTCQSE